MFFTLHISVSSCIPREIKKIARLTFCAFYNLQLETFCVETIQQCILNIINKKSFILFLENGLSADIITYLRV